MIDSLPIDAAWRDKTENTPDGGNDDVEMGLNGTCTVDDARFPKFCGDSLQAGENDQHREWQHMPHGIDDDQDAVRYLVGEPQHLVSAEKFDHAVDNTTEVIVEKPGECHGTDQVGQHVGDQHDAEHYRACSGARVKGRRDGVPQNQQNNKGSCRNSESEKHRSTETWIGKSCGEVLQANKAPRGTIVNALETPLDSANERDDQKSSHHQQARCKEQPKLTCLHRRVLLRRLRSEAALCPQSSIHWL